MYKVRDSAEFTTVPYSDHSCFAEIKEFVKIVQPTSLKGIVSSSSSYVDPLYYFGRLLGEKLRSQRLNRNFDQKGGYPSGFYICIVYKKVSFQTIAWVANRDKPLSDKYPSVLKIIDGNLVLLDESQIPIWSTNQNSTASNSVVAVLRDDGNFVLKDGFNSTQSIWQSFDFPSNTLLPGSKIGYNKRTNTHRYLTSWKKSEDPSDGLFSLSLDAINKQYVILWNKSEQYWTSGRWNGEIFSGVPEMRSNYIYNFTYVDNENESYFMYWVYDPSIMTRLIIDVSGQIKQMTWLENPGQWNVFWAQSREQCEVYAVCGAFGTCNQNTKPFCTCLNGFSHKSAGDRSLNYYSGRCVRDAELQCGNTSVANQESTDKFYVYSNMRLPVNSLSVNASSSASDCESSCLNNCSCTAYSYDSNGCSIWIGELMNLQQLSSNDGSGRTLHLRLAASEFPKNPKGNKKEIIIGVVVGSVVVLLGLVLILIWKRQRSFVAVEGFLVAFGYKDLQIATKKFSEKLGGGGVAITAKADVYSYGMMLFELVSGRRNSAQSQDKKSKFFPIWAASVVAEGGDVFNLLDHRLENNADEEELRRIARVACWCIQDAENHRPTMGQVVQILEGVLEVNLPQVPRLLQAFTDLPSGQSSDLCFLSQRAGSETS
ncbi:hypothetical protein Vadar_027486 [Vaccinium darrowii]|uniref:Uncharacterized protein n=1 Tax=Vaccinium darrowii TaxID=229202 RepID=A0ACB7XV26_9ERIC|nr:hypothetical protein Vadar_027486 [Vaccinium darrowii]